MSAVVRIEERLIGQIGVREWGLPSLRMPGQIWRSEESSRVFCMLAKEDEPKMLRIDSLPLEIVGIGEPNWIPEAWSAALREYAQAWPSSGCGYGPFLRLTEDERNSFLRKLGQNLLDSDRIGCQSIADGIGKFAAFGYEKLNEQDLWRTMAARPV